jgi:hypothetical protein
MIRFGLFLMSVFVLADAETRLQAADGFPRQIHGVWTDSERSCRDFNGKYGPAGFVRDKQFWVKITAQDVLGTTNGKFVRAAGPRSAEAIDLENRNIMIDFTLRPDGRLEERVVGARASMIYVRCR